MSNDNTIFGGPTRLTFQEGRSRISRLLLEVASGADRGKSIQVENSPISIGSGEENQLVLLDDTVSRRHAELVPTPFGARIRDLGSTNGTFVAGTQITDATLPPGARLRIGGTELLLRSAEEDFQLPASDSEAFGQVMGKSVAMRRVFGVLERVAATSSTVLLTGETGTGKGALAQAIHDESTRNAGKMIVVDCGAIPGALMESELFGHEKGAFTGAVASRKGAFEQADGGTLFLDEVGELPLELQPKLLRVLENGEFRRVGGGQSLKVEVRVIAATNRDLVQEIQSGRFREDLYYRLAVIQVAVPSLRERSDDIEMLAKYFMKHGGIDEETLDAGTIQALSSHHWPGNVRELRNLVERSVVLTGGMQAPDSVGVGGPMPNNPKQLLAALTSLEIPFKDAKERLVERFERAYVDRLLERAGDGASVSELARLSGLDRKHVRTLLERHRPERSE